VVKTFPGNHIRWSVRHVALVESLTFPGFPQKRSPCMQQMSCLKSTDASWSLWLAVNRPPMDHCGRFASNNEYYRCQQITTNSERQRKPNNINKCVQLRTYADNVALPATAAAIYCRVHSKLKKYKIQALFKELSRTQIAFFKHQNYRQKAIP